MAKIDSVIDGKYKVLEEIGRGGMSVVYLARDQRLNKQWAIKEILKKANTQDDEIAINSLMAEANLMKNLDHPVLPRIVDIIDNGKTIYVIMDYIEGRSLDKELKEKGPQSEERVLGWAKQLCEGLSYLHSQKPPIIYRDMKPANVMLKPEGNTVKIIDFGIAREYKDSGDTKIMGTPGYASPEQHRGKSTPRSDIFSLGMTMAHLLTGMGPDSYAPVRQWNPELSEGIEAIIEKCVQMDESKRYQNCAELLYDLEHPDKITKEYKRKQKGKLRNFIISAVMSAVMLISGVACGFASNAVKSNNYEELIAISTSSELEDKISNYRQAIELYPNDPRAYMLMLEAYESEGVGGFGSKENSVFQAVYGANSKYLDTTDVTIAELRYRIGLMYFNYYSKDTGELHSFGTRVEKALPYFRDNYNYASELEEPFEEQILSDSYYLVLYFYDEYIRESSTSMETASKQDFLDLFDTIRNTMDAIADEGTYNKLSLYNGVFNLLYDCRDQLKATNVEKELVMDLFEDVYGAAYDLGEQTKAQVNELRQEMIDHYGSYKDAIGRTYSNKQNSSTATEEGENNG